MGFSPFTNVMPAFQNRLSSVQIFNYTPMLPEHQTFQGY